MSISSPSIEKSEHRDSDAKSKHFYWLDWIRFAAAFMVVACHARGWNWVAWGQLPPEDRTPLIQAFYIVTRPGLEWVVVFFVLSGFLVGGKTLERTLDKTFDPWAFAIDRVSRIWVPLIPALLLTAGSALYCGYPLSLSGLLGNLLGLQGIFCDCFGHNAPLWSLSYEIWFYLLAGVTAMIVIQSQGRLWLWLGLAICFAAFTRLDPVFLSCWLLGAFSYFLTSRKKAVGISLLGLFLAVLGTLFSQLQAESKSVAIGSFSQWLPSDDIACLIESLGIGLLLADVCRRKPTSSLAIRAERWGTSLAAFSYTLYLTHYPILDLWEHFIPKRCEEFDLSSFLVFMGKILSCLLMGWLLYLPFEAQTASVRGWLKNQLRPLTGTSNRA